MAPPVTGTGVGPLGRRVAGRKHVLRKDREQYRRAFNKNLFIGDVTGNGRSDLLIEWTHRELHVFPGVAGPELFADLSQKVSIELPNDEEHTWLTDINRDGRQDIVMHHPLTKRDAHGAPEMPPGYRTAARNDVDRTVKNKWKISRIEALASRISRATNE